MTEPSKSTEVSQGFRDSDAAPFVYFDLAAAHGVLAGAVQIELVGRVLVPLADNSVRVEFVTTGHLRCSPGAAQTLRAALDKALEMLGMPQEPPGGSAATKN